MKKITKKLFSSLFTSTILLSPLASFSGEISTNTTDLGFFVAEDPTVARDGSNNTLGLYKLSSDGSVTRLQSDVFPDNTTVSFSASQFTVDEREGKIYFLENQRSGGLPRRYRKYDIENNEFEGYITITGLPEGGEPHLMGVIQKLNDTIEKKCESSDSDCDDTSDTKFVSLGGDGDDELLRIDNDGISQGGSTGKSLVKYVGDELHIGENSWITKEEGGRQKVYAKDAAGNPIPIDYTNGTKLLINGRDVEQSINNVGALSAALTGLPTVPTDTTLACGFGTGTHGGDFAFAGGCASKVNEKLSINYAASTTMPGQDYAGDFEDTFSARAGFVWKLGKPVKPTLISMKEKKEFETQINTLEETNKQLLARLEKLEKVALGSIQSKDLASNKINFKSLNKELEKNNF
ncbi:hypothetical protein EU99_0227 [Prochlorococcus marinus str. MIT 9321]|uniref:Trimeric autotransporter adhesin YadA-like C-terminal membrane anchor domain-containing protein n=1 Tax=Prochlorococcus marinus str. MIT 9401 TaxID=167551 RepID=A0A0A2AYM7_PROMR|nr:YadA C-terminal domain-containing protein [Prochlorococcus marinus]KGG05846.1 hypothetical protein EU99_0227 [Prochlorococcus marinus str. MIT 9321]KGG06128.1 hypothetical protein EV00_0428 [Prochlorococcus marinus str. MIT 9322]KGG06701.1 hypothetical protein EV01_1906 [Prochlorococcus marinus str. MIT 9401]